MARKPKVFLGNIDAEKAANFYARMHALKDEMELLQKQHAEDMAEVIAEASEAMGVDPALFRMAFTTERQERKRAQRIEKMGSAKAVQLDLLSDAAAGEVSASPRANRADRAKARTSEAMADHVEESRELVEAGLISPEAHQENVVIASKIAEKFGNGGSAHKGPELPAFLDRRTKPPPDPVH